MWANDSVKYIKKEGKEREMWCYVCGEYGMKMKQNMNEWMSDKSPKPAVEAEKGNIWPHIFIHTTEKLWRSSDTHRKKEETSQLIIMLWRWKFSAVVVGLRDVWRGAARRAASQSTAVGTLVFCLMIMNKSENIERRRERRRRNRRKDSVHGHSVRFWTGIYECLRQPIEERNWAERERIDDERWHNTR